MNFAENNDVSAKTPKSKQPYQAPTLSEYGDIGEITLTGMPSTSPDNAGMEVNMT